MLDDTAVRGQLYRRVFATGRVPTIAELSDALAADAGDVKASLRRLAEGRIVVLQRGGDEIVMLPPFSAVPTPFLVTSRNLRCFANCIWDALGVLAILRRDGEVHTACACCSYEMTLTVSGGALQPHEGLVHFAVPARKWWDNIVFT